LFDGKPNNAYHDPEMASIRNRKIGFVFQSFNLLPQLSVRENIKLPLLYSDNTLESDWDNRISQVIEKVGLGARADFPSVKLSGGEKQRVAIARALINNPLLILADEPTGNLDSQSSQNIMDLLRELNQEHGQTIIMVTHEPELASQTQRIITMKDGLIIADSKDSKTNKPL
jgi:putative ABC transport system ATP-binding protein